MPELKQFLADQGLSLEHAEVFTHDFAGRNNGDRDAERDERTSQDSVEEEGTPAAQLLRNRGYVTADGLDFWV